MSENKVRERGIYRVTIVGSIVNFVLLIFKFFAGIVGHSAAMMLYIRFPILLPM